MHSKILIVGAFHEVIELAQDNGVEIAGLIDSSPKDSYRGYQIIGSDEIARNLNKDFQLIITPDSPKARYRLVMLYKNLGFRFTNLISKDAKISKSAFIDEGTVIQYGVNVSADVSIGKFVKLNTFCNVMHNSIVGDYTTVAPNAIILGNVKIGKSCYIGSNATILPSIEICDNVIIGAGAVVTKSILKKGIFVGNPAKELRK